MRGGVAVALYWLIPMYIKRDHKGNVVAVSREPMAGFVYEASDHASGPEDVFGGDGHGSDFVASDLDFVRVLEDLLNVLMAKGVVNFTELPVEAQKKLFLRDQLRQRNDSLNLLIDDE